MKMVLLRFLTTVICTVFITTGAVSGEDVLKAVGDQVSFRPDKFIPLVTSIIWKHRNTAGITVKAIEWEEGAPEILIPNPRFKNITTVDEKTGEITITNLKVEHSGEYMIDINGNEQEQRFSLTVMKRVPKPVIELEMINDNPEVPYLNTEDSYTFTPQNVSEETKGCPFNGEGVKKAVGDQVSFCPDKFITPVTSVIWKHRNTDGIPVKAIEWNEGETLILNQRFRGITSVDKKTGQITITNLKVEHSGVYTIEINSKEEQRFTLTVTVSIKGCAVAAVIPSITMVIIMFLL